MLLFLSARYTNIKIPEGCHDYRKIEFKSNQTP